MRSFNRSSEQLRPFSIERGIQYQAAASVLIKMGHTHVLCAVSVEEGVPPFLEGSGRGWITAEYGMLPCATDSRFRRETERRSGRTLEIQRLIGRSLRMMVDLKHLDDWTLRVDCDVVNADGGTRTASVTGASLAVYDALKTMAADGRLAAVPPVLPVTAVSVGVVRGAVLLDLDYSEDSSAATDANFVMAGRGDDARWVELGATAEKTPFTDAEFGQMLSVARKGCLELATLWD